MQPFFPAVGLIDALPQHFSHVAQLSNLALCIEFLLLFFQLCQSVVFVHRELRTHVRSAHACLWIILRIVHVVGIVTLDITAVRTDLSRQLACHLGVKERRMQIRSHLAYDEAWPDVIQTHLVQTGFQTLKERVKRLLVCQTAVNLFRSYFVTDRSDAVRLAEILGMLDEFYRAFYHHMDVDDLTFRQEDIYGRVNVDQVITGEDSGLVTLLHAVHSALGVPALDTLFVLEPRTSVVDSYYVRTGVMNSRCLTGKNLRELSLRHAGVTAVAVHLVQSRREIDRRVVTFRCAERCFDYCQ